MAPVIAALPTFAAEPLAHEPIVVEEYDPNEIMEQLEENEPDISSVETDDEVEEDNPYLIEEQQGHNKEELLRMLQENENRRHVLEKLIEEKENDLFKHIAKEECERLKKMLKEEEELEQGLMKAFKDQKVLYNFYKVIQLDSQLGECYRTIGQIKDKLQGMGVLNNA